MARQKIPKKIEAQVLIKSARRCVLCFHILGDLTEKLGQIAHLDHEASHNDLDNLAFLCMEHHSLYDSTTRQHKNYTESETKHARDALYAAIANKQHFNVSTPGKPPRRKPRLNFVFDLNQRIWGYGGQLQPNGKLKKMMQIGFWAVITNDSEEPLAILEAYPEGTQPQVNSFQQFLPPKRPVRRMISAMVVPILGKPGESVRARFILKDQYGRSYHTPRTEFRWTSSGIESAPD
jgi:hypothetical protein